MDDVKKQTGQASIGDATHDWFKDGLDETIAGRPVEALLRAALERAAALRHLPESTYRLQLHAKFTFDDASAIAPYLAKLGVTHCYASPYLTATPGSMHGYDVIDHCSINPELGGEAALRKWLETLRASNLRHILDIVPNHVGIATNDNKWWNDVLEHGRKSPYANYFDIAWEGSPKPELHEKILLPILGGPYGEVLENGELTLKRVDGKAYVCYYDRRFPIDRATLHEVHVESLNGTKGDPRSFDKLDELLNRQHYRLAYWKNASDEIDYRRFFDVNTLAALAMERPEVFEATHALIVKLVADGDCAGLRVDHPDGLFDPARYLLRLQKHFIVECARQDVAADEWPNVKRALLARLDDETAKNAVANPPWPLYVVAEKILAMGEPLPGNWAVHGTSGYDFLNIANGLFVDTTAEEAMTELYEEFTGDATKFSEIVYQKKKLILKTSLASELHMLAHRLDRIGEEDRRTRDFTENGLRHALMEVIACFPVYRSYVCETGHCESDTKQLDIAIERAKARKENIDESVFNFIRETVLNNPAFAGRFQQLTSPVTAKGVEDTAFYCYHRLISLNEVGGEPDHFGVSPEQAHAYFTDRQKHWPYALSALSTHDTKRSEDVRARINVLSEIPDEWRQKVTHWATINAPLKTDGAPAPDEEYLIYQTLLGAWPITAERMKEYLTKAMREAKLRTQWTAPNEAHEAAVANFAAALIDRNRSAKFLTDFEPFQKRIAEFGMINSLAQTVLKIAAPGVPDTYQGTELWDLSLVDPDNRRPVDYARRREAMESLTTASAAELWSRHADGRIKLFLTMRALETRRALSPLFTLGEYVPGNVSGALREHVFAFARRYEDRTAVCIIPRLLAKLGDGRVDWADTRVSFDGFEPATKMRDVFTETTVRATDGVAVAPAFDSLPFALLVS